MSTLRNNTTLHQTDDTPFSIVSCQRNGIILSKSRLDGMSQRIQDEQRSLRLTIGFRRLLNGRMPAGSVVFPDTRFLDNG